MKLLTRESEFDRKLPAQANGAGVATWVRDWLRPNVAYLALGLMVVIFWAQAGGRFMSVNNWELMLQQTPVLALLAAAETFVITAGYIDLSVGAVLGLSAFLGADLAQKHGPLGLVVGVLLGIALGALNGTIFALLRIPSFVTTLATMVILTAALAIASNGSAVYIANPTTGGAGKLAWLSTLGTFPWIVVAFVVVFLPIWVIYNRTPFGQYLRAMGGDERVAGLFGVPLRRYKVLVFSVVGLITGLAAIATLAQNGAATPLTGSNDELNAIAAVVLGGTPLTGGYGSVTKTVAGALALTVVADGLTIAGVPPSWNDVVYGLLLIVAIAVALDRRKIGIVK